MDLLYSSGNSTQYSVMAYMRKESNKRLVICIRRTFIVKCFIFKSWAVLTLALERFLNYFLLTDLLQKGVSSIPRRWLVQWEWNFMVKSPCNWSTLRVRCSLVSGLTLFWVSLSESQVLFHVGKVSSFVAPLMKGKDSGRSGAVPQSLWAHRVSSSSPLGPLPGLTVLTLYHDTTLPILESSLGIVFSHYWETPIRPTNLLLITPHGASWIYSLNY